MASGSEQPKWAWTKARVCDTCGRQTLLKNIGRFYRQGGEDSIRCMECGAARVEEFVDRTRKSLGLCGCRKFAIQPGCERHAVR